MLTLDLQLVIAEISLGLAGFTGVALSLRQARVDKLDPRDVFGIVVILACSGSALVFSLAPFALEAAGVPLNLASRISSILLSLICLFAMGYILSKATNNPPRHPWSFWILIISGFLLSLGVLVTGSGIVSYSADMAPLLLLWLLLVGFAQFTTFLVLAWKTDH